MSEKAQVHIRALKRLVQELSWSQLDEVYFAIGAENKRRQDLEAERAAAEQRSPT